nr:uncharacterized protein LOC113702099 isoform X2 [Coffea arabica]
MATLSLTTSMIPRKSRTAIMPRAALNQEYKMRVPYELKQGQSRRFHKLPSGLNMEVIFQEGLKHKSSDERQEESQIPPLVFVHGSFHAAWCWAEHWLPYFSQNGYDCYALSLLGQGESDDPAGPVAGTLQTHAGNVADFIQKELKLRPVLIGHSFGGLIVQYYVANMRSNKIQESGRLHSYLAGAALVCSVPPSAKQYGDISSPNLLLHLSYQKLMTESSRMPLFDLRKLNASLPVPSVNNSCAKILVLGANDDFIVDMEGLNETGRFYGVSPICLEGVAHDMMLDCSWEKGAEALLLWLSGSDKEVANTEKSLPIAV